LKSKKEKFITRIKDALCPIYKRLWRNVTHEYSIDKISYKNILILDDLGAAQYRMAKRNALDLLIKDILLRKKHLSLQIS